MCEQLINWAPPSREPKQTAPGGCPVSRTALTSQNGVGLGTLSTWYALDASSFTGSF